MSNTLIINRERLNKKTNLLDELASRKIGDILKDTITSNGVAPKVYFLHNIRRFGTYSYLLTQESGASYDNNFSVSFLYEEIKKHKSNTKYDFPEEILSDEDLNNIIQYALTISEVHELLRKISFTKCSTANEKLLHILNFFNKLNFDDLKKIEEDSGAEDFRLIIKIALLSIPQLRASSTYSCFSDGNIFASGDKKKKKTENLLKTFAETSPKEDLSQKQLEKKELPLADRILLLVTLIEGFLWHISKENRIQYFGNFCYGNLYTVLKDNVDNILADNNISYEVKYNIETHSFYLNQFEFYIYGELKDYSKTEEILKKELAIAFISNLSDSILFSKSRISKLNNDSIHTWAELSNPIVPQSIANGIVSVALPKKIGIYKINKKEIKVKGKKKEIKKLESIDNIVFIRNYTEIPSLKMLNNPWALYVEGNEDEFNPKLTEFEEIEKKDVTTYESKQQVAIRVSNISEESRFIILEFDKSQKFSYKEFIEEFSDDNFSYYKYTFKAFIEKLQYIHRSASLNLNPSAWYNKAFCSLYKEFDKVRYKKQYIKGFRDWELKKIKEIIENRENIVIYNIGACYGRLEKNLMNDELSNNIKSIYSIDQNQEYLDGIKEYIYKDGRGKIDNILKEKANEKIITKRFDFRNIELIDNNEKADIVCITHTTLGYFEDDEENKYVLIKAFNLLKPGGVIIIDQFNPGTKPKHCNKSTNPTYVFTNNKQKYKGIKTSNHKTPTETKKDYGLYFGNYMYFDIKDGDEKLIKCDTYHIKLYNRKWFTSALVEKNCEITEEFVDEVKVGKDENIRSEFQTMLIAIKNTEMNSNQSDKTNFENNEDNSTKVLGDYTLGTKLNN